MTIFFSLRNTHGEKEREKTVHFCSVFSRVKQEGSHAEEFARLQGRIPELWTTGDVLAGRDPGKATISGSCHLNRI
jgi:hypothetical protein